MASPLTNSLNLKRRIIDAHLMIGLGCIFSCVVAVELIAWHEKLFDYIAIVVAAPLILLLFSTVLLRKNLSSYFDIESQLNMVSDEKNVDILTLSPLRNIGSVTKGWNCIVETLERYNRGESLSRKLQDIFSSGDAGNWQSILDAVPDALVVTNSELEIRNQNRAFDLMFANDKAGNAIFESLGEALHSLLNSEVSDQIADAIQLEPSETIELQNSEELSDGVWKLTRVAFDATSMQGSSLWIITDITHRRIVEEARDQFVFTATHELRTPLANIRAYAETLTTMDDIDAEQQKSFINIINTEASRLSRFIDQLLNISQMEAGAITIDRHETDVMRMLSEIKDNIQSLVDKKEQLFSLKIPAKVPKLWIDKDKIASAITNLLSNANKYTPSAGEIRLIVEEDESNLQIHVEDTGFGISAEELPKIARKFFRSEDERVRGEIGSGIGLAFAQEVAKLHGGKIAISSELNKGSRFTLSLPLTLRKR